MISQIKVPLFTNISLFVTQFNSIAFTKEIQSQYKKLYTEILFTFVNLLYHKSLLLPNNFVCINLFKIQANQSCNANKNRPELSLILKFFKQKRNIPFLQSIFTIGVPSFIYYYFLNFLTIRMSSPKNFICSNSPKNLDVTRSE